LLVRYALHGYYCLELETNYYYIVNQA